MVESTVYNEFVAAREARAENKGQRQALQATLLRIFKRKWVSEPPTDLTRKIEAEENSARLQEWVDEAVLASSIQAFRLATGL